MIISCLLAFFSQNNNSEIDNDYNTKSNFHLFPFALSLIIPWFFLSFTQIGVDYINYYNIVARVDWSNLTIGEDVELLFNILCVVLKTITGGNIHTAIFLMKTMTVLLIGISIYLMKDRIYVCYSVVAYLFLMYLASFYLISICLASSIVMLAVSIWRRYDIILIPFFLVILAGLLHNSVFILMPAFIFCLIVKGRYGKIFNIVIVVSFIIITLMASSIYNYVATHIPGFHYRYSEINNNGSGLMILLKYIPVFLCIKHECKNNKDQQLIKYIFFLSLTSCMFSFLAYRFEVIGRMEYNLLFLYGLLYPELFKETKEVYKKRYLNVNFYQLLVMGYYLFRGYFEFIARTNINSSIINYEFFNPFV
jgi:hypothetical protein